MARRSRRTEIEAYLLITGRGPYIKCRIFSCALGKPRVDFTLAILCLN